MINKTKKIILIFLIILDYFTLSGSAVHAAPTDVFLKSMDPAGITGATGTLMDTAFQKLGVDQNELKYAVKTFNVSRQKKQPPLTTHCVLNYSKKSLNNRY